MHHHHSTVMEAQQPLFERTDGNNLVELQRCRKKINELGKRVLELDKINGDIESRLETQAKLYFKAERKYEESDHLWELKYKNIEKELNDWKMKLSGEELKGEKLREQLNRTEKELYNILQRKYEMMRGQVPGGNAQGPGGDRPPAQTSLSSSNPFASSDGKPRGETSNKKRPTPLLSVEARQKKVISSLNDFFGL